MNVTVEREASPTHGVLYLQTGKEHRGESNVALGLVPKTQAEPPPDNRGEKSGRFQADGHREASDRGKIKKL